MTEAEALSSLADMAEISGEFEAVWISMTFGYLSVAYFVGKKLSRFQCLAISALYGYATFYFAGAAWQWVQAFELLAARERTIFDQLPGAGLSWTYVALYFYVGGLLLSFYFMYNVRNQKQTESIPSSKAMESDT